jgi:hypothetical protein
MRRTQSVPDHPDAGAFTLMPNRLAFAWACKYVAR